MVTGEPGVGVVDCREPRFACLRAWPGCPEPAPSPETSTPQPRRAIVFDRVGGIKNKVYPEGTHFIVPWFERPIIFDVRARPNVITSTSGSRDLQMVGGGAGRRAPGVCFCVMEGLGLGLGAGAPACQCPLGNAGVGGGRAAGAQMEPPGGGLGWAGRGGAGSSPAVHDG